MSHYSTAGGEAACAPINAVLRIPLVSQHPLGNQTNLLLCACCVPESEAMASKIEVEVELKSNENKVWDGIKNSATFFPKALPDLFESIEVLEGDGASVGSIRLVKFRQGLTEISTTKEKIEKIDDETRSLSYAVIDGDLLKFYKNYKASLSVIGDVPSRVKWSAEFDKESGDIPDPELIKGFAVKTFQDLDAYILANA